MLRISEHGNVVIVLAVSSALFAQSDDFPGKSNIHSTTPDARRIIESSIAVTQRHWQVRLHYSYIKRNEDRRRDSDGRVKSEDVDISRAVQVNGVPFEQLLERNGRPPSSEEERKQKARLDKLKQETPEQRAEQLRQQTEENAALVREVPKAFDFQLVREELVNGRPAYVLHASPHPGYSAQGKYGKMFSKVEGDLWIDKQDRGWIKVDGKVTQPFSMGLFLVRLLRGSQIKLQQTRVDDGIWMLERLEVRAAARIFFVKSLVIDRVLTYSEYRLAEANVSVTSDPVIQ